MIIRQGRVGSDAVSASENRTARTRSLPELNPFGVGVRIRSDVPVTPVLHAFRPRIRSSESDVCQINASG